MRLSLPPPPTISLPPSLPPVVILGLGHPLFPVIACVVVRVRVPAPAR